MKYTNGILLLFTIMLVQASALMANDTDKSLEEYSEEKIRLVVRIDDIGFSHASNMALERMLDEGCAVSAVSVLVNTPWLDQTVEILNKHPELSVGVHTCLNSEWKHYRWGPVLPAKEVPSIVDEWGKFFGTRGDMMANEPNLDEIEAEIRAQIDLAIAKGLNISYIDHHMGAAVQTPEMRARFEEIAADYGVAISRYFGETQAAGMYFPPPDEKKDKLIDGLEELEKPGIYLLVTHPGVNTPELAALRDLNEIGPKNMSEHRQAELDALCSPELAELIKRREFELIGYNYLQKNHLDEMTPPKE